MSNKCYIVGGIGCSGKTTFAEKLSKELNCRTFKCDDVYFKVGEKLGLTNLINLPMLQTWEKSNIEFGKYNNMRGVVLESYKDFLGEINDEILVLESGSLFWNKYELEVVKELLPDYDFRYLCLMPDYEQWLKNRSLRLQTNEPCPKFLDEVGYKNILYEYENLLPQNTLIITDILNTDCSLTGGTNYQSKEFSDPKWKVFNFPTDMRGKSFFDISCNTGAFSKKAFDCGAEVIGIDISWQVLDKTLDLVPDGNFKLMKIEDLSNYDNFHFDFILSSSAFHYYKNREKVIYKIAKMTDYFILETPILDDKDDNIVYQSDYKPDFCALVSESLLLKWLRTYFLKVEKIGETIQPNGKNRPVYKCTKSIYAH